MEDTLTPHRANKMLLFKVRSCDVRLSNKVRRQREADLLCNTISLSVRTFSCIILYEVNVVLIA